MPRSTNRAFEILEILAAGSRGLKHGEIAQALRIPKSSLTKIIKDLLINGYLEIDNVSRIYSIGPQVMVLARAYLGHLDIVKIAQPIIYEAMTKTGESATLFVKKGNLGVVISKENSPQIVSAMLKVGENVPLYATAGGKAILAFLSDEEIDNYLSSIELVSLTSTTITDPRRLRQELKTIRSTGLARSNGEQFEDLVSIAAPVFSLHDRVIASISMPFPKIRFNDEKQKIIEDTLRISSAKMSHKLGGTPQRFLDKGLEQKTKDGDSG